MRWNAAQLSDSVDAATKYFKANSSGTNYDSQINGLDRWQSVRAPWPMATARS